MAVLKGNPHFVAVAAVAVQDNELVDREQDDAGPGHVAVVAEGSCQSAVAERQLKAGFPEDLDSDPLPASTRGRH